MNIPTAQIQAYATVATAGTIRANARTVYLRARRTFAPTRYSARRGKPSGGGKAPRAGACACIRRATSRAAACVSAYVRPPDSDGDSPKRKQRACSAGNIRVGNAGTQRLAAGKPERRHYPDGTATTGRQRLPSGVAQFFMRNPLGGTDAA